MRLPSATFVDGDGFIERECPICYYTYKIKASDWENKTFEYEVFCPKCKGGSPSDSWWTKSQAELIRSLLTDRSIESNGERLVMIRGLKNRFEGADCYETVTYQKDRPYSFCNNPVGIKRMWENDVVCSSCGTEFKTVGNAFVCPCCSNDNLMRYYRSFLMSSSDMLDCVCEMKETVNMLTDDEDAERFGEELVYKMAEDIALGFQAYCQGVFRNISIGEYADKPFDSLAKADKRFIAIFGRGIAGSLDRDKIDTTEAVLHKVFSFISKKRKEKTPHIVIQDVYDTVNTLKDITERIIKITNMKNSTR